MSNNNNNNNVGSKQQRRIPPNTLTQFPNIDLTNVPTWKTFIKHGNLNTNTPQQKTATIKQYINI